MQIISWTTQQHMRRTADVNHANYQNAGKKEIWV
jgi:hypothetical protein